MGTAIRIVNRDDLSEVLFDLNDGTGAANPYGVCTAFGVGGAFGLKSPETEFSYISSPSRAGGRVVARRDPLVESSFRLRMWHPSSFDSFRSGVNELGERLAEGGVMEWTPHGASELRYIDFEPSRAPVLFEGEALELQEAMGRLDSPHGVLVVVTRQPYLRGPLIDSDVNLLANSMLLIDRDGNGRPDSWAWDNTGGISSEAIDAAREAYSFAIATTSTRNLEQTTATGTFAEGDVATFSFYAEAGAGSIARVRAVVRFLDSGGSPLGSEQLGSQVTLDASESRVTVTTSAAPASTSKAEVSIRFENLAATSVTVYLNRAQMEEASSASVYRCGTQDISLNPETSAKGRVVPIHIEGNAETPVRVEAEAGSGSIVTALRYASRISGGRVGARKLADFLNRHHVRASAADEMASPAEGYTDSGAASGTAMGESHVEQTAKNSGNSDSPSCSWGAQTKDGATLLMCLYVHRTSTAQTITPPGGWTQIYSYNALSADNMYVRVYKYEGASPRSGSEDFGLTTADPWSIILVETKGIRAVDSGVYDVNAATSSTPTVQTYGYSGGRVDRWCFGFIGNLIAGGGQTDTSTRGRQVDAIATNLPQGFYELDTTKLDDSEQAVIGSASITSALWYAVGFTCYKSEPIDGPHARLRWELTDKLDSLRGAFDVYARVRPTHADEWALQLRWTPTQSGLVSHVEPWRSYDFTQATTFDDWCEVYVGRIRLPEEPSLSGLAFELWTERSNTANSYEDIGFDSGLRVGELYLAPAEDTETMVQTLVEGELWYGSGLESPTVDPSGSAGTVVGTEMELDAAAENAGTSPNYGLPWSGWTEFRWALRWKAPTSAKSVKIRVRNLTDASSPLEETLPLAVTGQEYRTAIFTRRVNLTAGKKYQAQVDDPGGSGDFFIQSIEVVPLLPLGSGESFRSDPEVPAMRTFDSSGDMKGDAVLRGPTPDTLRPGLNLAYATLLEPNPTGYDQDAYGSNLTRTGRFAVSYYPRYRT